MKKAITILAIAMSILVLASCDSHSAMDHIVPPDGCHVYITYDHQNPVEVGTTQTYGGVYVGLETQSNYDNWDMCGYDLLVSRDGQFWEATDNVYFSVSTADTEYYLRIIGYSICRKEGYVYRCTSVCTLKVSKTGGDVQKTSMSYVEAAG